MDGTEKETGLQQVVPVSVFCSRYNVAEEVSRSFGLYNDGTRPVGEPEFEKLRSDLKARRVKRQREEMVFLSSKRCHFGVECLEGNTLISSYAYDLSSAALEPSDMLQTDLDVSFTLEQHTGKEMLVSEDVHGDATVGTQFQQLASAGSMECFPEPPAQIVDDCKPWILISEVDNARNSSPPASSW